MQPPSLPVSLTVVVGREKMVAAVQLSFSAFLMPKRPVPTSSIQRSFSAARKQASPRRMAKSGGLREGLPSVLATRTREPWCVFFLGFVLAQEGVLAVTLLPSTASLTPRKHAAPIGSVVRSSFSAARKQASPRRMAKSGGLREGLPSVLVERRKPSHLVYIYIVVAAVEAKTVVVVLAPSTASLTPRRR